METQIIIYTAGDPRNYNRMNRRQLSRDLKKISRLSKIDMAAFQAFEAVQKGLLSWGDVYGAYKEEFEKECVNLLKRNNFRYFELNLNFIEEKYGQKAEAFKKYENTGISIISRIRKFATRFY